MTAAMIRNELPAQLPSRMLREEAASGQGPAMVLSAGLLCLLLAAAGLLPTTPATSPLPPAVLDAFELGREPSSPPASVRTEAPAKLQVIPDAHRDVRPVDRPDVPAPPARTETEASNRTGSETGTGPVAATPGTGTGGGSTETTPEPGEVLFVDEFPSQIHTVTPEYPSLAREAGVDGTVVLWALVGIDGSVEEVRVQKSIPMLDDAAKEALRRWRFTPARTNGHAVRVWVSVPVRFRLHG